MSKKAIRSIIFLMSVSLLGLISFQAYWIVHSIEREAENFDRDVQQLIANVSEEIFKQEAEIVMEDYHLLRRRTSKKLEEDKGLRVIIANTTSQFELIGEDQEQIIVNAGDDKTTTITLKGSTTISKDRIIDRYESRKGVLAEVVEEMAFQYAVDDASLLDRLKGISIDTLISDKMNELGFYGVTYAYQLKDNQLDSIILKGNVIPDEKLYTTYTTSLADDGELNVSIQNKTFVILKTLWLTLALSLILTLILLGTFIYTINSILRQKRVANMKADFINNMTHEFKTPVATISLAIDSILHEEVKGKPAEIERFGGIIKKENARMNQQIESLLDIALFDKGKFHLNEEAVDVHELLVELKENFEMKARHQSGDIALFLNADSSSIRADRMHFYNVLRNILDNAIKFSGKAFRVKISTQSLKDSVIITFQDRGIGMDKNTVSKVFDRFYRKTEGDIHTTKGFGLGLAYVKEVIDKMGAEISAESKLNHGTSFTIKVKALI